MNDEIEIAAWETKLRAGHCIAAGQTGFRYPKAVATGPDGAVYAGCCGRPGGVQRFAWKDGSLVSEWSAEGGKVCGIAVDSTGNIRVTMHTADGPGVRQFAGDGSGGEAWDVDEGRLRNPQGIGMDSHGRVYVVEANLWGSKKRTDLNRIVRFGPAGSWQQSWGGTGTASGRLNLAVGVTVDAENRIHVADAYNCRIQVFAPDGSHLGAWGTFGPCPGQFNCPQDIAVDGKERIYVADTYNNRIQVFSSDREPLAQWGGDGTEPGRLWLPCGVAVDRDGRVYVADTMNHRIQVFEPCFGQPRSASAEAVSGRAYAGRDSPKGPPAQPVGSSGVQVQTGTHKVARALESAIRHIAMAGGASHFGIADLTRAWETWPESFEECGKLLTGVAIGVREDDDLLADLPLTDDAARTAHYADKMARALAIGDRIADELETRGHRAHRLSHPPRIKPTGLYKLTARLAGLGWIGRNRLLITPEAGPRVALAAVLTNAPLQPTAAQPLQDGCGNCRRCIDACPVHAYSEDPFGETDSLNGFATALCAANRGIINPSGWGLCGLCVKECPIGRREEP